MTIRILVVDQPALMRRTLSARLSVESDMQVVAEVDDVASAERLAHELDPHIILLDTEMPGLDLRESVQTLLANNPRRRVVVLTLDPLALRQQLPNGTVEVVGKHEGTRALVSAIRAAAADNQVD